MIFFFQDLSPKVWGIHHFFLSLCQSSWGKISPSLGTQISEYKLSILHRKDRTQQKSIANHFIFTLCWLETRLTHSLDLFFTRHLHIHSAFVNFCVPVAKTEIGTSHESSSPQTGSKISVPLWIVDVPSFFSSQLGSNNNSVTALWPFS